MADVMLQRCRTANCPNRQEGPLCAVHGGPAEVFYPADAAAKPTTPARRRPASKKAAPKSPGIKSPDGA